MRSIRGCLEHNPYDFTGYLDILDKDPHPRKDRETVTVIQMVYNLNMRHTGICNCCIEPLLI